jgi:ATP-dependent exoDNAse (exonuclease V) beta subunit
VIAEGVTRAKLVDDPARALIRGALERTFLVEAAAGTGKTTELVLRVLAVILSGRGRLSSIVAITFTEKAAGELKLRLRTELDRALFDAERTPAEKQRARAALSELEAANIGTIHGFCAELLRSHPVEAAIDPAFEVAEAERMQAVLEESFDAWFAELLEDPPEGVARVLKRREVDAGGPAPVQQLMAAAMQRIETRDFDAPFRRDPFARAEAVGEVLSELWSLAQLHEQGMHNDPLRGSLQALTRRLELARDYDLDASEAFLRRLMRDRDVWSKRTGKRALYCKELARADVLAQRERAQLRLEECVRACDADLAACLSRELGGAVRRYEEKKAQASLLDFFDLLLGARRLLQEDPALRAQLQAKFTHVFVDEFQDTDPVQTEIVLLLCADDAGEPDPWRTRPVAGKLFLVGDPKQSIYRFRRADIALYERVKRHLLARGGELLQLTTSFRSLPAIASCVNAAFAAAMSGAAADSGHADYVPLAAFRSERLEQPSVIALPVPEPYSGFGRITKAAIERSTPGAVAAFLDWLLRESGYKVREQGEDVAIEPRHVCLLFRRFRGYDDDVTRAYVRALEARNLPHILSGGRSFHAREEVVAVRSALGAIEWPDDRLHVYATLRGPLVAFHDETLFTFQHKVGHLHPLRPVDTTSLDGAERELAEVLDMLGSLHAARNREPIAATLARWLEFVRAHAGLAIWPAGEQALGNVMRLLDYARAYERRGAATSFRGFVEWLDAQAEAENTGDAQLVEDSSDCVRIRTVHSAKGLEFPVVVLCDPTAPLWRKEASRFIDPEQKLWAASLCDAQPIELWEQRERVREHDAAEIVRLLYVAATRAKDLLIVPVCGDAPIDGWLSVLTPALYPPRERCRSPLQPSTFRLPAFGDDSVASRTDYMPSGSVAPGEHMPERGEHHVVWWDPKLLERPARGAGGVAQHDLLRQDAGDSHAQRGEDAYRSFRERGDLTRAQASTPSLRSRSVTRAVHALAPDAPSPSFAFEIIDTRPEREGRPHGARFGSLVHALFEHAELRDERPQLAPLSAALGRGLGATPLEIDAAQQAVSRALAHPFFARVRAAALRGEVDRESSLIVRDAAGDVLDGVVDLAFREPDANGIQTLFIADFKTDVELVALDAYRAQLARYAEAAVMALGLPVFTLLVRV